MLVDYAALRAGLEIRLRDHRQLLAAAHRRHGPQALQLTPSHGGLRPTGVGRTTASGTDRRNPSVDPSSGRSAHHQWVNRGGVIPRPAAAALMATTAATRRPAVCRCRPSDEPVRDGSARKTATGDRTLAPPPQRSLPKARRGWPRGPSLRQEGSGSGRRRPGRSTPG
jgi:hypothetical protein